MAAPPLQQPLLVADDALAALHRAPLLVPHAVRLDALLVPLQALATSRSASAAAVGAACEACRQLAYGEFVPWLQAQTLVNKRYFIARGGVRLLAALVDAQLIAHTATPSDEAALALLLAAASALWNLADPVALYAALWLHGAVDALVRCVTASRSLRVVRVGVGALFGVLEQPSLAQVVVAAHPQLVCELVQVALAVLGDARTPYDLERALYGALAAVAAAPTTRALTLTAVVPLLPLLERGPSSADVLARFLQALLVAQLLHAQELALLADGGSGGGGQPRVIARKRAVQLESVLSAQVKMVEPPLLHAVLSARGLVLTSLAPLARLLHAHSHTLAAFAAYALAATLPAHHHAARLGQRAHDTLRVLATQPSLAAPATRRHAVTALAALPATVTMASRVPSLLALAQLTAERAAASDRKLLVRYQQLVTRLGLEVDAEEDATCETLDLPSTDDTPDEDTAPRSRCATELPRPLPRLQHEHPQLVDV